MTKHSALVCAALASAVAPGLAVTGARELPAPIHAHPLIDAAGLVDARGHVFDVHIASGTAQQLLRRRAANGVLIGSMFEKSGADITVDTPVAQGSTHDETGETVYVVITRHADGTPLNFEDLTEEECRSLGVAIARTHQLDACSLRNAGHTPYSGSQVRDQLTSWSQALARTRSVPDSITARWDELLHIDALWTFDPVVCHGSFHADDILFSADSTVTALHNWERLTLADPASDFAWLFDDGLQQWQRDDVLAGYGEILRDKMDSRIVPRARLWRQLMAVRDLLEALRKADHGRIAAARRKVNAIASALSPVIAVGAGKSVTAVPGSGSGQSPTRAEKPSPDTPDSADATRPTNVAADRAKDTSSPLSAPAALSRLSQLDDKTVLSGKDLSFTGTGDQAASKSRTPSSRNRKQQTAPASNLPQSSSHKSDETDESPRCATNTNMPALDQDGTRTTLAAAHDTRHARADEQARTKPFETQAYIDTDAPDGTVHVTHSTTVRERLFPDDAGEDLFASRKNSGPGQDRKMSSGTPAHGVGNAGHAGHPAGNEES